VLPKALKISAILNKWKLEENAPFCNKMIIKKPPKILRKKTKNITWT